MIVKGYKTLPNSCLRVLVQILAMTDAGHRVTMRAVAERLSFKSPAHVAVAFARLKKEGLISYEGGMGRGGTVRPTCRATFFVKDGVPPGTP